VTRQVSCKWSLCCWDVHNFPPASQSIHRTASTYGLVSGESVSVLFDLVWPRCAALRLCDARMSGQVRFFADRGGVRDLGCVFHLGKTASTMGIAPVPYGQVSSFTSPPWTWSSHLPLNLRSNPLIEIP